MQRSRLKMKLCVHMSASTDVSYIIATDPFDGGFLESDEEPHVLAMDGFPKNCMLYFTVYKQMNKALVKMGTINLDPHRLDVTVRPKTPRLVERECRKTVSPRRYNFIKAKCKSFEMHLNYVFREYTELGKEYCQLLIKNISLYYCGFSTRSLTSNLNF